MNAIVFAFFFHTYCPSNVLFAVLGGATRPSALPDVLVPPDAPAAAALARALAPDETAPAFATVAGLAAGGGVGIAGMEGEPKIGIIKTPKC